MRQIQNLLLDLIILDVVLACFADGFTFHGCYWDDDGKTLSAEQSPTASTVECLEVCLNANAGYIYAGTQSNPERCFCGVTLNSANPMVSNSECNIYVSCPTTSTDKCGAFARLAVYDISGETVPISLGGNTKSAGNMTTVYRTYHNDFSSTLPAETEKMTTTTKPTGPYSNSSITTTTTTTATALNSTLSQSSTNTNGCLCKCSKWYYLKDLNLTKDELTEALKDDLINLQNNIAVDAKSTSSYKNQRLSAPDDRYSSVLIGYFGGSLLCVPIVLIITCDILRFTNMTQKK